MIQDFNRECLNLAKEFTIKYYGENYLEYLEGEDNMYMPYCFCIGDEWWDLSDMWMALNYDIQEEILFQWREEMEARDWEQEGFTNLLNYFKNYDYILKKPRFVE